MLIGLYIFIRSIFGGADTLALKIEDTIADEARRAEAVLIVERIAQIETGLAEQVQATSEELRQVHQRHDATRGDYIDALHPLEDLRQDAALGLLEARAGLREILSAEEWSAVFSATED